MNTIPLPIVKAALKIIDVNERDRDFARLQIINGKIYAFHRHFCMQCCGFSDISGAIAFEDLGLATFLGSEICINETSYKIKDIEFLYGESCNYANLFERLFSEKPIDGAPCLISGHYAKRCADIVKILGGDIKSMPLIKRVYSGSCEIETGRDDVRIVVSDVRGVK